MSLHRLDNQVPGHAVEEFRDVQVNDPVAFPATFPASLDRLQGRSAGPVSEGISMEHRLHADPQMPGHDRLSDPVSDTRYAKSPGAATMRFRDLHRTHRRRKPSPR